MSGGDWKQIGHVAHLARYPLKGAQGQDVDETRIGWHGLSHDRGFALLRHQDMSGLPWVSPRQFPAVLQWHASIPPGSGDLQITDGSSTWNLDPKDSGMRQHFGEFATKRLGEPMSLVQLWSGTFDSMPISIISTATLQAVARLVGRDTIDRRRFRPNIVLCTDPARPWPERQWLGRDLRFGDSGDAPVLRVDRATTRCEVVDFSPPGDGHQLGLFAAIRENNRNRAGVYATPRHVGRIVAGVNVWIR